MYWQINSTDGKSYYADNEKTAKKELKKLQKKRYIVEGQIIEYRMFCVEEK